jgi:adenosylhomocysteine nucleosidase
VSALLFVAADRREFDGFARRLENAQKLRWQADYAAEGRLHGRRALLVANGPGPELAAAACDEAFERAEVGAIISTGLCGGLRPDLQVNDIFVATEVRSEGIRYSARAPKCAVKYASGVLISQDRVAVTTVEKEALRRGGAAAVDMEAASVAGRAADRKAAFFCVRVVSDAADEGFDLDLNMVRGEDGRFDSRRMAVAAARNPVAVLPETLRLWRRITRASSVLGEFLAGCEF